MDGALRDIPKDGWEYEPIGPTAFGISKGGHVANFSFFFCISLPLELRFKVQGRKDGYP